MGNSEKIKGFKVGDIIRNKKPYWGEPIRKIVDMDENNVYAVRGPSKYGLGHNKKYREIMFHDQMSYYKKPNVFIVLYLYFIGFIAESKKK